MIEINKNKVELNRFPDGTLALRYYDNSPVQNIRWRYDGDEECMAIWYLVHHIRESYPLTEINLYLPYLPNARMDRVKNEDEVFTLKWFAKFINGLRFDRVWVTDPHSNVGIALLDRVSQEDIKPNVYGWVLNDIERGTHDTVLCFPDEGASKKYASMFPDYPHVFGIKHRDWRTGKILGLSITNEELVSGHQVLIVDDICSRGGTFMHTAAALKEAGATKVYLYVTHCENNIFNGDVLSSDLIEHVYTTDSIFRGSHPKITVL